jgi:prepilin-type N-terminal cleavage/methylation domain-containing protein
MAGSRRPSLSPCRREDGFTIIEVMVASVVLLVGIMGVLSIVIQADGVSTSNRAREQGVALQREVIEDARSIPYDALTQNSIVSKLQAQPGLADSTAGSSGWTIRRRNVTYTIAVGTCSVDDSNDGTGPHESAGYCVNGTGSTTPSQCLTFLGRTGSIAGTGAASGATAADCGIDSNFDGAVDGLVDSSGGPCSNCSGADTNPNDYKRIVVLVRWNRGLGSRYALQSATVPNPGLSAAPAVSSLLPVSMTVLPGTPQPVTFAATVSFPATTVAWYVDGTFQGQATGSLTSWSVPWNMGTVSTGASPNPGEVLDGTYLVSAKGFDAYGQAGTAKASTVIVNRRAPYPPSNPHVGRNDGNAYLDWGGNAERDVEGYRIFRVVPAGTDQDVCGFISQQTRCRENGMPSGTQQYYVRAIDRDSSGVLRYGDPSPIVTVPASDTSPTPLPTLVAAKSGQNTVLSWTASSDPDAGDSIQYYRIYRDGSDWVSDYYDRTNSGSNLSYTDSSTNGDVHTYYVVAVDQSNQESRPIGTGVTK